MEGGGQRDEHRRFMQSLQNDTTVLHAACVAENSARAKGLIELAALLSDKAARKKSMEELTRRLEEKQLARKKSVLDIEHMENAVAA